MVSPFTSFFYGAGEGNRTLTTSLEGWSSTTELHPQINILLCDFFVALSIILKSFMLVKQVLSAFSVKGTVLLTAPLF